MKRRREPVPYPPRGKQKTAATGKSSTKDASASAFFPFFLMVWGYQLPCVIHSKAIITFSSCSINYGVLLDEVGRCAGVDDIGRYCRNLLDNTGMKRVVVLQDGYCTGLGVEIFDYTEHMSRVQD